MEIPIRISKISANSKVRMIYLPKILVEKYGFSKGTRVFIKFDPKNERIIIEKLSDI